MANFVPSKKRKVLELTKHISLLFLLAVSIMWLGQQEEVVLHKTMPQEHRYCTIVKKQSVAERAIAHLHSEQIAIPILTTGELPGYHPHHSKPKCLHQAYRDKWHDIRASFISGFASHRSPIHQHAIDYYIYTLEHILI